MAWCRQKMTFFYLPGIGSICDVPLSLGGGPIPGGPIPGGPMPGGPIPGGPIPGGGMPGGGILNGGPWFIILIASTRQRSSDSNFSSPFGSSKKKSDVLILQPEKKLRICGKKYVLEISKPRDKRFREILF